MRKLVIMPIIAALASPAIAGDHGPPPPWGYGYRPGRQIHCPGPQWYFDGYNCRNLGHEPEFPPTPPSYGYGYVNGGAPPPPPPVPVIPAWCEAKDKIFIPSLNAHTCKPVLVPRH